MTSTPAVAHPTLSGMGRAAPGYVRRRRHRRRVALTRQSATAVLLLGVVVSGPVLASSGGPQAAARPNHGARAAKTSPAAARPRAAEATVVKSVARRRSTMTTNVVSEAFVAPAAPRSDAADAETAFRGATAARGDRRVWVTYPTGRFHPFLVCTRSFESDTAGGYEAVSADGRHRGAYQFKQSTWNTVARHVGRTDLVGVDPAAAAARDQDWMALYLYKWLGASHWEGRCAGK